MVKTISFAFLCLYSHFSWALTQVTASIDKNPVILNESIILTVVANDDINTNSFDTSALIKDFVVGRTSINSSTQMINGSTTQTTTWTTLLMPKKTGQLVIPAFKINHLETQPISVEVISATKSQSAAPKNIFISSKLSAQETYVQQMLTLTVKLHFSVDLKRGSLSEPHLDNATITQIGEDKESTEIIQGMRYRVIERNYSINPQSSGNLTLKSPIFNGEILQQSQRRSAFSSFSQGKPVQIKGDDVRITVKAIPNDYQGNWLPSELVTLHEEWQPSTNEFMVGEPITRVITLTAAGLSQEQLTQLNMSAPKGIKVYPDQAEMHSSVNNNKLVSQKVQNFALVASKAGEYTLPAITLSWWNTVTNKPAQAVLAARTIKVLPNEEFALTPIQSPTITEKVKMNAQDTVIINKSSNLQWVFLALWLLTSFAWIISAYVNKKNDKQVLKNTRKTEVNNLLKACKLNDGHTVLEQLCPWLNEHFNTHKIITLDDAILYVNDPKLTEAIYDLQQAYFGKNTSVWQGTNLAVFLKNLQKHKQQQKVEFELNPK